MSEILPFLSPGHRPSRATRPPTPRFPPRFGRPGRLLFRCVPLSGDEREFAEVYASAKDFDEGKQSFFLKRPSRGKGEVLYPLHGHFLEGGSTGVFMVHDGQGTRAGEEFRIDQSVNLGLLLVRPSGNDFRAILDVTAEERAEDLNGAGGPTPAEYSCVWKEAARPITSQSGRVRSAPNSGATPPSHWLRESDTTLLTCAAAPSGEYRLELRGSKIWPGHLGFLVVTMPGTEQPVGYNVHLLARAGHLLIHAHSYPHRPRQHPLDTMEETETVIGGLLLTKTASGYEGWVGLSSSSADPYNISFSRDATMGDYAAMGRTVIPPSPVTCR